MSEPTRVEHLPVIPSRTGARLTHKHYTGLARPAKYKRTRLLGIFVSYEEKKMFCKYSSWRPTNRLSIQFIVSDSIVDIIFKIHRLMVHTTCLICLVSTVSGCHKNALVRLSTSSRYITKLEQSTFLSIGEVRWGEVRWGEARRGEARRGEVRWGKVR
jgi:hypothetical protein